MSEPSEPSLTPSASGGPAPSPGPVRGPVPGASARPRINEPTQQELDDLPADRRIELLELQRQREDTERERRRQNRHQWFTSISISFGVLFTAAGLIGTALALRTGQEQLLATEEGQVTDRYTKAIGQIGSSKPDVRLGGIYALERLMTDSPRDRNAILNVLATHLRRHAQDKPPIGTTNSTLLATDTEAALTILGENSTPKNKPNLSYIDLHDKYLYDANLSNMNMFGANLKLSYIHTADLSGTDLTKADMSGTNLLQAKLPRAKLIQADLTCDYSTDQEQCKELDCAHMPSGRRPPEQNPCVDLRRADLSGADLTSANLSHTDLSGTNLTSANLTGANLTGANLRGVVGMSPEEIRNIAITDTTTEF